MSQNSYGWNASVRTQSDGKTILQLNCSTGEDLCRSACNNPQSCEVESAPCYDCASTSNYALNDFFVGLGSWYRSDFSKEVNLPDVIQGRFLFFDEETLFNFEGAYEDEKLGNKLSTLCPEMNQHAIVVVELSEITLRKNDVKYALCNSYFPSTNSKLFKIEN